MASSFISVCNSESEIVALQLVRYASLETWLRGWHSGDKVYDRQSRRIFQFLAMADSKYF